MAKIVGKLTLPGTKWKTKKRVWGVIPTRKTRLACYLMGRAYGGPEEGGWYYDTYERLGHGVVIDPRDPKAGIKVAKLLYFIKLMACKGEEWVIGEDKGAYLPLEKPFYD